LFSEKLGSFEAKVSPDLWANVASQVGTASGAVATGGMSLLTKAIIGISGAAVVTTGVVLYTNSNSETPEPKKEETAVTLDSPSQNKKINTPKEDPKTFVVENNTSNQNDIPQNNVASQNSIEPSVDPNRNIAPTMGPGDGGDTLIVDNVTSAPIPMKPVVNDPNVGATVMPILPDEKVTKEDEPIRVQPIDIVESPVVREEIRVVMPNIFTPNGDRRNDDYFMKESNVTFDSFELVVYNSRREQVYKTTDPDFKWDGRDDRSGEYVQLDNGRGTFVYFITATTVDGRGFTASEIITIQQ